MKSKFISLQVRFYTRVLTFCKEEKKRGRDKERDLTKKEKGGNGLGSAPLVE